jgi:glycolate oxidase
VIVIPTLPRATAAHVDAAKSALDRALGPSKVITDDAGCAPYARDDSAALGTTPDAVVIATSREDVAKTLEIAARYGIPVTPRAGGSGRTGGAVPVAGGIVLATHALAQIKEIDRQNLLAVVEPGVILAALHAEVEALGLFYPPDPNSADLCMIGGNLGENAGGPRAFKYGVTRDYVLGVEACLMGGEIVRSGKRTTKGVTGYDITALLIGSEGTLGVFTEATLRLVPKPRQVATMLALYADVHAAGASVSNVVAAGLVPRCLELLDTQTLDAIRSAGNAIDARAGAMLLIEVDGDDAMAACQRLGEVVSRDALDVVVAQDEAQRARLWSARKALSYATRRLTKHKLSEDVVVPRTEIPTLLRRVEAIGERFAVRHLTYGHAGDGNLHVNFLWNDDEEAPAVSMAIEALMHATIELGGTLSGEHGIGLAKAPYLAIEQSSALIELQKRVKVAFDPKGLLNPGKIFPSSGHRSC